MHYTVTTLVDNAVTPSGKALLGEHGLSFYIEAILGGLHLGKASDGKLAKIIDHLRGFDLEMVGAGHCTGPRAFLALAKAFKDRVFFNTVGNVVEFSNQ